MRPTKSQAFFMAAALGTVLSAPLAVANTTRSEPRTSAQEKIAERLDRFESVASSMRTEMDHYASSVRSHNPHMQAHIYRLNYAKERVNDLGVKLSEPVPMHA